MIIKIAITAGVLIASFAVALYAVNKTASKMSEENSKLPEEDRKTDEELDSGLLNQFVEDVKSNTLIKAVCLTLKDIQDLGDRFQEYRITLALLVLVARGSGLIIVPAAAISAAMSTLAYDLAYRLIAHSYNSCGESS